MDREAIQERFGIVGESAAIRQVIDRIRQVASTELTVTIQGESGVGKELAARAIHDLSPRRHEPLVVVNCGAIPEGLIESELFGNVKGAYTGAVERRTGHFEEADGGTLFLDEIGEMPAQAQVRLLRVLESGEFTKVGASEPRHVDVRVIAATNKDLGAEVEAGRFREDLYYRISTVIIEIPPLRERTDDILPIFRHFLHEVSTKYEAPMKRLDESAVDLLKRYRWPGNVRELRNLAEQVEVLVDAKRLSAEEIEPFLRGVTTSSSTALTLSDSASGAGGGFDESGPNELIYRFLMDLRLEIRELGQMVRAMAVRMGISPSHGSFSPGSGGSYEPEEGELMLPEGSPEFSEEPSSRSRAVGSEPDRGDDDSDSFVEDVIYEIEEETGEEGPGSNGPEGGLPTMEEAERALIQQALRRFDGNRRRTAEALGISERTLYRKLKQMDLEEEG